MNIGSGATTVQIVEKRHRQCTIVEHLGSVHTDAELAALVEISTVRLNAGQDQLDLDVDDQGSPVDAPAVVQTMTSRLLMQMMRASWERLEFDAITDEAFFQPVAARLAEPTSKIDSLRVIVGPGIDPVHLSTVKRCLQRCTDKDYRRYATDACFRHVWAGTGGDVSLVLHDATALLCRPTSRARRLRVASVPWCGGSWEVGVTWRRIHRLGQPRRS